MKKFNDLTAKPKKKEITNKHIIETRGDKPKVIRKKKFRDKSKEKIKNTLSTKLSENYEGKVDGIIAYIDTLPLAIKDLLNNGNLKTTVIRQGYSMYVLDNKITIKIKDEKLNNKNYLQIRITQRKKELFNNRIKW